VKRREALVNNDALAGLVDLKHVASTIGLDEDDAVADVDVSPPEPRDLSTVIPPCSGCTASSTRW
jgi:hypothetical protein